MINSSGLYNKTTPIWTSDVENVLQSPMQNISLLSPNRQSSCFNVFRSSNNSPSDSDENPSVLYKDTSFYEGAESAQECLPMSIQEECLPMSADLGRRDSGLFSVEDECDTFGDNLIENCSRNNTRNSEEHFHWNPVIIKSPKICVDKQTDEELDCVLQDRTNFMDKQIVEELYSTGQQIGPSSDNSQYCNNSECFSDFNESVLQNDSVCSVDSNYSSNNINGGKNCFQKCEDYWSRAGQVCLKTSFQVSKM